MNNDAITLVVSDIDGTLIGRDERLIEPLIGLRGRLGELGIDLTIATGRIDAMTRPFVDALGIELPYITSNGAVVRTVDRILAQTLMPAGGLRSLFEGAQQRGFSVLYTLGGVEYVLHETPWIWAQRAEFDRYHLVREVAEDEWGTLELEKVTVVDQEREGRIGWAETTARALGSPYAVTRYSNKAVELVSEGCSKGSGLERVLQATGHRASATLVVGDHQNDLEMFEIAGRRGAVANAIPSVKAAADYVSGLEYGEGLMEIIDRLTMQGARR